MSKTNTSNVATSNVVHVATAAGNIRFTQRPSGAIRVHAPRALGASFAIVPIDGGKFTAVFRGAHKDEFDSITAVARTAEGVYKQVTRQLLAA